MRRPEVLVVVCGRRVGVVGVVSCWAIVRCRWQVAVLWPRLQARTVESQHRWQYKGNAECLAAVLLLSCCCLWSTGMRGTATEVPMGQQADKVAVAGMPQELCTCHRGTCQHRGRDTQQFAVWTPSHAAGQHQLEVRLQRSSSQA